MAKLFNRAKMTTATTGTSTLSLGSASVGFQTFASAGVGNGDVVQYAIKDGANFEIGTGTFSSSGNTLTRSATESSSGGSAINLSGSANVAITAIDDDFNRLDHNGSTKMVATSGGSTVTGTLAATALSGNGASLTGIVSIPSGTIFLWSGSTASIPSGWVICNGSSGTPDLRNEFVVGAGGTYAVDANAGASNVTLANTNIASHSHSWSANTGAGGDHSHNFNANTGNSGNHTHSGSTSNVGNHTHTGTGGTGGGIYMSSNNSTYKGLGGANANTGAAGSHSHNISTNGGGDHSHNFNANTGNSGNHTHSVSGNTGNTGSGNSFSILPVYYALAYIQKT